jgi:membrane protease YdiL (CAAX protease family)
MNEPDSSLPELPPLPAPPRPPWRWAAHLLVLGLFPPLIGLWSYLTSRMAGDKPTTILPDTISGLLLSVLLELTLFFFIFFLAWSFSRADRDQLFLRWKGGVKPLLFGMVYSVGLRIALSIGLVIFMMLAVAMGQNLEDLTRMVRPETENVVSTDALLANPLYFWMNLTLVSFVLAGFREELWRAGMIAGFAGLFPKAYSSWGGKIAVVAIIAIIFGFGHLPQGWGGVFLTGTLGFGLGMIMVFHRSIWEAVLAHGFFNATTFAALYLVAKYFPEQLKAFQ